MPRVYLSQPAALRFLLTRTSRGLWHVRDERGMIEGLFVNEREARRFARAECGGRGAELHVQVLG